MISSASLLSIAAPSSLRISRAYGDPSSTSASVAIPRPRVRVTSLGRTGPVDETILAYFSPARESVLLSAEDGVELAERLRQRWGEGLELVGLAGVESGVPGGGLVGERR